jgi:hypothetical protein
MHTLPGKDQIRISACIGKVPKEYISVPFKYSWPLFIVIALSVLFYIGFYIFKLYLKYFGLSKLKKFENFKNSTLPYKNTIMYSYVAAFLAMVLLIGSILTAFKLTSMHPEEIDTYPNYLMLYMQELFVGTSCVLFFLITYLSKNESVRKYVLKEIARIFTAKLCSRN